MIFLGCLFDRNKESYYLSRSKCGISNAVNGFQWNLIDGIEANLGNPPKIINVLPVGIFPLQYKDFLLKDRVWNYKNTQNYELGCINLPFIKQYQRYLRCRKLLKKSDDKNILIYTPYEPFLKAAYKLDKSYNVTLVVTDLPEFYDLGKVSALKKFLRKRNNKKVYKYLERIDNFVLLTEQMKDPLNVGARPYTVVEGICSQQQSGFERKINSDVKRILYTGTLHKQFGIGNLIDAFSMIKSPDYELVICGGGDYENTIIETAKNDSRIKFLGYVSKEEVLRLQSEATVLVNPRLNVGEYTKYSFPSKTMEYLLSGVPLIAYKLSGIPDDYDKYINYVTDNSPETLRDVLVEVCEDIGGIYEQKASQAIDFLKSEKSPRKQAEKILSLMKY